MKTSYLLLCFLLFSFTTKAQTGFDLIYSFAPIPTQSVYSPIYSIYPDTQNILVAGVTYRNATDPYPNSAAFIGAFDYTGHLQWKKQLSFNPPKYQNTELAYLNGLAKLGPNKYILGGHGYEFMPAVNELRIRPFLYLFKSNGDSLKFISIPSGDQLLNSFYLFSVMVDKKYNIISTGPYWNNKYGDTVGLWISKHDSSGNFLWQKIVLDTPIYNTGARAYKVIEGINNSYLIAGIGMTLDTLHSSRYAVWKTDTNGRVIWRKQIPIAPDWPSNTFYTYEPGFDIIKASNNSGYYFVASKPKTQATSGSTTGVNLIYYCGKFNENGNLVWAKTYELDTMLGNISAAIEQKANGDLLFMGKAVGASVQSAGPTGGTTLFCTDSLGSLKWCRVTKRYTCPYDVGHVMFSMKVAPNGNIVRGGYIFQFNKQPGCYDTAEAIGWLVMTDSLGRKSATDTVTYPVLTDTIYVPLDTTHPTGNAIRLIPDEEKPFIALYPNPVTDYVHIALHNFNGLPALVSLQVIDYTGRMVLQKNMAAMEDVIDLAAYTKGIYLIRLRYKDRDIGVEKVIRR